MLTVLIATYNGAATLPRVLQAYCALQAPPQGWRLLIVDNGSSDDSAHVIAGFRGRLPLRCLHEGRRGKNVALNTALASALDDPEDDESELFVFSDDDAAPEPDWLLRLSSCATSHPDYAIFGGAIFADGAVAPPSWVTRLVPPGLTYAITDPALPEGPVFAGLVWGANMALRRAIFDAGHRFDEAVGPNGGAYAMGGETLLTRRLADAGYRSWFCPAARVGHHIRAYQLTAAHILQRAHRFGRGKFRQDFLQNRGQFPTLMRVPRWMWPRFALELAGAGRAWLRRDRDRLFLHRWEMHYLSGYLYEAWAGRASNCAATAPRVLITSYSGELGGMELRMGQEGRLLAAAGYRALLATRRFPGFDAWAEALRGGGIDVSVFDPPSFFEQWPWRRWNRLRALVVGARALRRYQADLVHVAFCWNTYGASALWLVRRCGLPAVISVHNAFPPAELDRWYRPLMHEAFLSVRGIYAVSESAMQHFLALYRDYIAPTTRLAVIPNSVDLQRFAPSPQGKTAARLRLGLPKGALVLGSVARLSEQKRPQALLRLFCALAMNLPADLPELYLVFVGSGPLEAALRRQAEAAGVSQRVLFAGYSDAVETLLPAFDLHLLLSRNEGFGIATIEAMACGVPVVGTDVPGTADILRGSRGGVLVPLADEEEAVVQVSALLRDPQRRLAMARCARAEMEAGYGNARLEKQVLAFYRGLT